MNLLFRAGKTPSLSQTFESFFFNSTEHIAQQGNKDVTLFELIHEKNKSSYALIWVFEERNRATSPFKSSFGSFEFNAQLSLRKLNEFIDKICKDLIEKKCKKFFIRSWPQCYEPGSSSLLHLALLQAGFQIKTTDLNFHIPIVEKSLSSNMDISERNRFNKAKKNDFTFELLDPALYLGDAYTLLEETVAKHKVRISMSLRELSNVFHLFPDNYFLFGVFNKEKKLAGASVGVKVNASVFYLFYLGFDKKFTTFSPLVFLIDGIYNFCKEKKYQILDLGIATEKGNPNYGLIHFKRNLGGIACLKLSYEKILDV